MKDQWQETSLGVGKLLVVEQMSLVIFIFFIYSNMIQLCNRVLRLWSKLVLRSLINEILVSFPTTVLNGCFFLRKNSTK